MKTITLSINIPDGYRYYVVQPWGQIMFFKERPVIEETDLEEFWAQQDDEMEFFSNPLLMDANMTNSWKDSIIDIGA